VTEENIMKNEPLVRQTIVKENKNFRGLPITCKKLARGCHINRPSGILFAIPLKKLDFKMLKQRNNSQF
jgi:hypothetical protein